jgi:hypothetical protein
VPANKEISKKHPNKMLFEMNGIGCIFVDRPRWKGQWVIVGGLTGKMTSKKPSCFSWKTISKKKTVRQMGSYPQHHGHCR